MDLNVIGVTPAKQKQFNKKGIMTVENLIGYIPYKYNDYRFPKNIRELNDGDNVSIIGKVVSFSSTIKKAVSIKIEDNNGDRLDVIWFNQLYVARMINIGSTYIFCGKVTFNKYTFKLQMANPAFSCYINKYKRIIPIYHKIKGMSDDYLNKKINSALSVFKRSDYLDKDITDQYGIVSLKQAARMIHRPSDSSDIDSAKKRIIFDSLFKLAYTLSYENSKNNNKSSVVCPKANSVKMLLNTLPFKLTDGKGGQLFVVREIYRKMKKGIKTNSLVQGDVGCGKTMVAMLLMLIMAENGYQSVLMAPTNVLAYQHYIEFSERLKIFDFIHVVFLNGSMKAKEKKKVLEEISDGKANIIIGTHALLSESVIFKDLALSIVDEEHRFGVEQRKLINEKVKGDIHHVTMSATPIPRSLGLSLYGDSTDIYTITQMPAGRKQIITKVETDEKSAYNFIYKEIKKGRQAYVICPLIDESDSERMEDVDSVKEAYVRLSAFFMLKPEVKLAQINGKMKKNEIDDVIKGFHDGKYNVLVSTTIVEVGVNVPNATVMMVKNAERFGLAQLHQLRGRVGRGKYQSYCILLSSKEDVERLKIMTDTNDGFKIAEKDLEIRGMGDFIGTKQSGSFKNVMLMISNRALYDKIKHTVLEIIKDPVRSKKYKFLLN